MIVMFIINFLSFILGVVVCFLSDLIFKLIINFELHKTPEIDDINQHHQFKRIMKRDPIPRCNNNTYIHHIMKCKYIIKKLYLAELCKVFFFILSLFLTFKHLQLLPINSKIFIITIIIYLIFNFAKNLLKLIL